jgi:catechol 2,3-dioxygenase-like lactoylglutathione lyase family enzyme
MTAKLKHIAIVSSDPPRVAEFYRELFGMTGRLRGDAGADAAKDGYVGLNVNTRPPGRQAGLDHFGFEVESVEEIEARLQDDYPKIQIAKRPGTRGFAAFSTHDPLGNVFDLSPLDMANKGDLYLDLAEKQRHGRRISHLFLRAVDPEALTRFYQEIYEFQEQPKEAGDPNSYLTDGTLTFVIAPWQITDYNGSGIERPALDHIGFEVESLETFQHDLQQLSADRPELAPPPKKGRGEGDARMNLFAKCKLGTLQLWDPDGVLLDVSEYR